MTGQESDIVVTAFGPRYLAAAKKVLGFEGGHSNDPVDRGGETNLGVSLRFLVAEGQIDLNGDGVADYDLDMDGDIDGADIRKLTRNDALGLFQRCFWNRLDADSFAKPIGEMMFDQAVNGGLVAARKLLQTAINRVARNNRFNVPDLAIDGDIGTETRRQLAAILQRADGLATIVDAYRAAAAARYRGIVRRNPSQSKYINGWLRRARALGE